MHRLTFSEAEQQALHKERFEHPHPLLHTRIEVLWLISQGLVHAEAAHLAGVSEATVDRYVAPIVTAASTPCGNFTGASIGAGQRLRQRRGQAD